MFSNGLILNNLDEGTLVPIALIVLLSLACALIGYFLGGINTSIIIAKLFYKDDIRNYGSHNAGMTNVMRTYGTKSAVLTLAGDFLKTVIAVMLARVLFGNDGAYIAGMMSVVGHIYPCYFGFKGGKGVVAVLGMILCTDPLCCLILFVLFAVLVAAYKFISLGSVMCMLLYPLLSYRLLLYRANLKGMPGVGIIPTICTFIVAALIIFKHKENIKRLLDGTESKFTFKKSVKKNDTSEESEESNQK